MNKARLGGLFFRLQRWPLCADVASTVIGMLDFDYDTTFFGIDVLLSDNYSSRLIPLNHNRDIALFDGAICSRSVFA